MAKDAIRAYVESLRNDQAQIPHDIDDQPVKELRRVTVPG